MPVTTQPAPLLVATPQMWKAELDGKGINPSSHYAACLKSTKQALADGRTRCIQPLSEEEQRTAFYEFIDDWMRVNKSYPSGIDCWLACARAMGAVR